MREASHNQAIGPAEFRGRGRHWLAGISPGRCASEEDALCWREIGWGGLTRHRARQTSSRARRETDQWGPRGSEPAHKLGWLGRTGKELGRIPVLWPKTGVSFLFLFIYFPFFLFSNLNLNLNYFVEIFVLKLNVQFNHNIMKINYKFISIFISSFPL
jgi:hypothetical protein